MDEAPGWHSEFHDVYPSRSTAVPVSTTPNLGVGVWAISLRSSAMVGRVAEAAFAITSMPSVSFASAIASPTGSAGGVSISTRSKCERRKPSSFWSRAASISSAGCGVGVPAVSTYRLPVGVSEPFPPALGLDRIAPGWNRVQRVLERRLAEHQIPDPRGGGQVEEAVEGGLAQVEIDQHDPPASAREGDGQVRDGGRLALARQRAGDQERTGTVGEVREVDRQPQLAVPLGDRSRRLGQHRQRKRVVRAGRGVGDPGEQRDAEPLHHLVGRAHVGVERLGEKRERHTEREPEQHAQDHVARRAGLHLRGRRRGARDARRRRLDQLQLHQPLVLLRQVRELGPQPGRVLALSLLDVDVVVERGDAPVEAGDRGRQVGGALAGVRGLERPGVGVHEGDRGRGAGVGDAEGEDVGGVVRRHLGVRDQPAGGVAGHAGGAQRGAGDRRGVGERRGGLEVARLCVRGSGGGAARDLCRRVEVDLRGGLEQRLLAG